MMNPSPLRLGVWCAVLRDGDLLLSKRSDLNVWALPGGRLDAGESLPDAAAREVAEETGLHVANLRPVGLYYLAGWQRLNILFAGEAAGGELRGRTAETRDNRFFPLAALPEMPLAAPVRDVVAGVTGQARIITTPSLRRWSLRARFGLRYAENALRGRHEPAFPVFCVSAVALVTSADGSRLLTVSGPETAAGQLRGLLRTGIVAESAPWTQLAGVLERQSALRTSLRWLGVWQDPASGVVEFVFAGRAESLARGEWIAARTVALDGQDADYLRRAGEAAPWFIEALPGASHAQPVAAPR